MFKELISKIANELVSNGIPYMIIGGQAVLIYGEPRMTRDIDITLGIDIDEHENIIKIAKILDLRIIPDNPFEFLERTMVLPLIDDKTMIRVDFIFSFSLYEKQAIDNGKKIEIEGVSVNFISLEDLIIHKLIAGRAVDIEDIKVVLVKNSYFNKDYILKWLKEIDRSLNTDHAEIFTKLIGEKWN